MTVEPSRDEVQDPAHPSGPGEPQVDSLRSSDVAQLLIEGEGRSDRLFLLMGQVVTIGRTPSNALPLPHGAVSRLHAELRLTPAGAMLTDMGSKNGTFVGSTQLVANQPVRVLPGSVIRIGPFTIRYQVVHAAAPAEAVPEAPEERSAALPSADVAPLPMAPAAYMAPPPARGVYPMPLPDGTASLYLDFLPAIFQDNDFMGRFLQIFQSVWEPLEHRQDHMPMFIDPKTAPAAFLPWLAGWLGVNVAGRLPEGRLRALVGEAVELYRWRGTHYGLTRMIEVCTGVTPVIAETASNPFVLHIRIFVPPDSDLDRDQVERLVVANKPAHTAYLLEVVG